MFGAIFVLIILPLIIIAMSIIIFYFSNRRISMDTQKEQNEISRREFCKSVPCTVVGVLASSSMVGISLKGDTSKRSFEKSLSRTEDSMAEKITAVHAKVISKEGTCELHEVGDVVKFSETGVEGKICIHALYSILPKIFAMMYEAQFPWLKDPDVSTHACPDAYNPVVFEVRRIRGT